MSSKREGPAAWIAAGAALVVVATIAVSFVVHRRSPKPSLADTIRTTSTVPGSLPEVVPLPPGPLAVPGGADGVRCRTVSGGPKPGLHCLMSYLVRGNDPRPHVVAVEIAYESDGPWTHEVHAFMNQPGTQAPDSLLSSTIQLRAPDRVYLRAYATFDDGQPFLPRSASTRPVAINLQADGTLRCERPHRVTTPARADICAFSTDDRYSD